ncbi:MAG: 50S ribosomal protein L11 methyltransferase [Acidobacteria bacterium]|nr:50S ribosomal protein L11 methyltransferase [Acidobacteriota bacterium]
MSLIVDEHRQYLADEPRIAAYREAIAEVVRPGDVVLDLGSGTGILGLLSCRAGAKRVYSIEKSGMVELARSIARANGFGDRVVFIKGFSTRVELPEEVDVVVCDQIGRFGFEAGVLEFFEDARKRFLKPNGKLIPSCIEMTVAPVEDATLWNQIEFWNGSPAGFDFRPARAWAANTGYPAHYAPDELLGEPVVLARTDLTRATTAPFRGEAHLAVTRAGTLHGIGGWFAAQLSLSVTMTNSPLASQSIARSNAFLPIDQPVGVAPGDCVHVKMHVMPSDLMLTWNVEVREHHPGAPGPSSNGLKGRFSHSTMHGMLLCSEDLKKTRPEFVPQLSLWGEARRSILELCDGHRPLAEIEQEILRRHANLFPSLKEAAAFVAEVVTAYSQ